MARDGRDGRDGQSIQGPPGRQGMAGKDAYELAITRGHFSGTFDDWIESLHGRDGPSAFDIARRNGFIGTEEDWFASLVGKQGEAGPRGPEGSQGSPGPIGPMPQHQWRGTELRFQQGPDGAWGAYVNLQGPQGEQSDFTGAGFGGAVVVQGGSWMPSGW